MVTVATDKLISLQVTLYGDARTKLLPNKIRPVVEEPQSTRFRSSLLRNRRVAV